MGGERLIRRAYASHPERGFGISHTETWRSEGDRWRGRGKINVNLKIRKALIFH